MNRFFCIAFSLIAFLTAANAQDIPRELWGTWAIQREIPTSTNSCWGENDAKAIVGTTIEYTAESFRWKTFITNRPIVGKATVTAKQFHDQNSGRSSQISFQQLGIMVDSATQIRIEHAAANITSATVEIPGDVVIVKDAGAIIFSVCNVYFEAHRVPQSSRERSR